MLLFSVVNSAIVNAQQLHTEGFDGTFPSNGWINSAATCTGFGWTQVSAGTNPANTPHYGTGMLYFNSYAAPTGCSAYICTPKFDLSGIGANLGYISFWFYKDASINYAANQDKVEVYMNTANNLNGATLLGTLYRDITQQPIVATAGWYQYQIYYPGTFSDTSNYILFKAISAWGESMSLDDLSWQEYPSQPYITVTPTSYNFNYIPVGNASTSQPISLDGGNFTTASGNITLYAPFGFKVSLNASTSFADSIQVPFTGSAITATTVYTRFAPTSPNTIYTGNIIVSGGGATTNLAVAGTTQMPYCTSSATNAEDEEILNVKIGTLNNSSDCNTLASGPSSVKNEYSNYTLSVAAPNLMQSLTYPFSVQIGTCGSNYSNGVAIFIDYNQNGVFDSIQYNGVWYPERVYYSPNYAVGPHTETGNIIIPPNATTGLIRMRVVNVETGTPNTIQPCGTYSYGETEDYTVNIIQSVNCTVPVAQPTGLTALPNYNYITASFTASASADHYLIVRSQSNSLTSLPVNGVIYNAGTSLGGGTVVAYQSELTFTDNNLNIATQYYYYIFAANSICAGSSPKYLTTNPLFQMISTVSPTTKHAVANGNWNNPSTWSPAIVPLKNDSVFIDNNYTVYVDAADSCYNLIINQAGTLKATGQTGVLNIQKNLTNNGVVNLFTNDTIKASLNFFGPQSSSYEGAGTNNIYKIGLDKAFYGDITPPAPYLDINLNNLTVKNVSTDTTGFIPANFRGIYKFSGTFNLTNRLFASANYSIPSSGGIWLNNPNFTIAGQTGNAQLNGLLHISQGNYNVGTAINNTLYQNTNSYFIMEGGKLNTTGRFYCDASASFVLLNGIITVATEGNNLPSASFDFGSISPVNYLVAGGTIAIQNANTSYHKMDARLPLLTTNNVTVFGGTVQLGNNHSPSIAQSFYLEGDFWDVYVDTTTSQHEVRLSDTTSVNDNFFSPGRSTFYIGDSSLGQTLNLIGNITIGGKLNGSFSSYCSLNVIGTSHQYLNFGNNSQITSLTLNNPAGADINSLTVIRKVSLVSGTYAANPLILGDASANTFDFIQQGGSFITAPLFNYNNMIVNYTYNDTIAQTTGSSIPLNISGTLTLNNSKGLTLGKKLYAGNLYLSSGRLNTSSNCPLTITNTSTGAIVGYSSTKFVNGPLVRTFPSNTINIGTWIYPVGTVSLNQDTILYNPFAIVNPSTGASPYVKVTVNKNNYSGTPGQYMLSINNDRRWLVELDSGNLNYTKISLTDISIDATKGIAVSSTPNGIYNGLRTTSNLNTLITSDSLTIVAPYYYAVGIKNPMTYISCTTSQSEFGIVSKGSANQMLIGFQVVTNGDTNPLVLSGVSFNTNGSTSLNDFKKFRLYSTGTNPVFLNQIPIDSTSTISNTFTLNPSVVAPFYLSEGINYFWLSCDISPNAVNNDLIDAQCLSITVDGIPRVPSITVPNGNRTVYTSDTTILFSQNFDTIWNSVEDLSPAWQSSSTGNNKWHISNYTGIDWLNPFSGIYSPDGALGTNHSIRYHSSGSPSGSISELITPTINCSGNAGIKKLDFYYINTSGTDNINVYISTDNGLNWSNSFMKADVQASWHLYSILLGNITTSQLKIKFTAISDNGISDIGIDQVKVYNVSDANMKFLSTTAEQTVLTPALIGKSNQQILTLKIATINSTLPLVVNSFTLNTNGSTNALNDIDSAKIYYTGTSNLFATTNLFGAKANPNGAFTITGNKSLETNSTSTVDTNYFWLIYNIKNTAVSFDSIDAEYTSLMLSGIQLTPDITSPIGKRALRNQLNGIYTIDYSLPASLSNYFDFPSVINDLNNMGISGAVTFNVKANQSWNINCGSTSPDNYALRITATGTATNTIAFQKDGSGANPTLIIRGTNASDDKGIWLNGCDYITFDGIDINDAGYSVTNYLDYGFYIKDERNGDGCNHNTYKNGTISLHRDNPNAYAIFIDTSSNSQNNYNKFYNNSIKDATIGYYFNGNLNSGNSLGNEIGIFNGGRSLITGLGSNTSPIALGILALYQDSLRLFNTIVDSVISQSASGIYCKYTSNTNIFNDTIHSITNVGTSDCFGVNLENGRGVNNVYQNYISYIINTGNTGSVTGLNISNNSPSNNSVTFNVYKNEVKNCIGNANLKGIYSGGFTNNNSTINLYNNKVYGLNSTLSSLNAYFADGISSSGKGVFSLYNNIVSDVNMPYGNVAPSVRGINAQGSASRIYNNTVFLDSLNIQMPSYSSACIYATNDASSLDIRNNIFINKNSVNNSLRAVAFWCNSTNNSSLIANNNLYYAGTPGLKNLIYYDGTNSIQSISAYKSFMCLSREQQSTTEDVQFINKITKPFDLHINSSLPTRVESHGQRIISPVSVPTDIDGNLRWGESLYTGSGLQPDLGAYEFNGIIIDDQPPILNYVSLPNSTSLAGVYLSNVSITDPLSGVNNSSAKPRVYIKKSTNNNDSLSWKFVEPNNTSSPFNFYLDYSLLNTSVNIGDTIQYFIISQDNAANPNTIVTATLKNNISSTHLNSTNFPVTNPGSFNICTPINGNYYIGAGQQFTSLTNDSITGFFNYLNHNVITGTINAYITSDLINETGTIPLNPFTIEGNANYSLTIIPSDSNIKTISGNIANALFRINGADNITINGSHNTINHLLNIVNTNSQGSGILLGKGSDSCSITNCIISGSSNTTQGTSGINIEASVNNLNVDNNIITNFYNGFVANGTSVNLNTNLILSNNILGSDIDSLSIGNCGINLSAYSNGVDIKNNIVKNIKIDSIPTGIYIGNEVTNVNIKSNYIHDIIYTGNFNSGGVGIKIYTEDTSSNISVINNVMYRIYGDGGTDWNNACVSGINIQGNTGGIRLYNNSINLFGSSISNSSQTLSADLYFGIGVKNIDIRNNVFKNNIFNSGNNYSKAFAIYSDAPNNAFNDINYNDYYNSGSQGIVGYINSTSINDISTWKGFTFKDLNSINADPLFLNDTSLIPSICPISPLIAKGEILTDVSTDILNDQRSLLPSIGAYELNNTKKLNVKAFLQGYYNKINNLMDQANDIDLNTGELFPIFSYPVVDTLTLLIRINIAPDYPIIAEYNGLNLNADGTITELSLPYNITGSNYIVLIHRNCLETWSDSVDFSCLSIDYNFYQHTPSLQFPSNMFYNTATNRNFLWSGDCTGAFNVKDGIINIWDLNLIFDALNDVTGELNLGYRIGDLTGNGNIDIFDLSIAFDNLNSGASIVNPFVFK